MTLPAGVVPDTLTTLGIPVVGTKGDELQAHCPAHLQRTGKEDANPSWYINARTGMHICFSCNFRGTLEYLVAVLTGVDLDRATALVQGREQHLDTASIHARLARVDHAEQQARARQSCLPESSLALFDAPPSWALTDRKLTASAAASYQILWHADREQWIAPLREPVAAGLLGWQAKGQLDRSFRNYPVTVKAKSTLFGWTAVADQDCIIAVESPLDAVRLESVGIPGGVAFCGATVSEEQFILLRQAPRLVVAFDNPKVDIAGARAGRMFLEQAQRLGLDFWFFAYGGTPCKDVGEMPARDIRRGVRDAAHCVRGVKAMYR